MARFTCPVRIHLQNFSMTRVPAWSMTAVLATGAAFAARVPDSAACSSGRLMGVRSELFVLATAREDTVRAGPGPIDYEDRDTAALESIHGQRFRIDRMGGDVPAELEGAGDEAVLVPHGDHCGDPWRWEEARWAAPGTQLFIDLTLRPRAQWAGGVPTFDVDLVHDRYPDSYTEHVDSVPSELMTAAQVFEMNQALPTWKEMQAAPESAYAPLLAWVRADPARAARFPATLALEWANGTLQPCVPAYDPHPVAGTYRATVIVESTDTVTFYFRTDARGGAECGPPPPLDAAVLRPRTADTARLYAHGATHEAAITETSPEVWEREGSCGVTVLEVVNQPRVDAAALRGWQADYDLALLRCFPHHAALRRANAKLYPRHAHLRKQELGWFREMAGGGMRFGQRLRVDERVVLEVTATRVSARTVPTY